MKKLLICLVLALVLVFTFVACKDNNETPNPGTTDPVTPPVTECTHEYGDWSTDASVECTDTNRLYRVCTKCGAKETKADACSFGEWTKVEGKLCSDKDRLVRECTKCGKTEKSADGACVMGDFVVVTAPTCEEAGLSEATCSKCGDKATLETPALGHAVAEGSEWNILKPATCTEDGIKFGTCVNCNVTGEFTIEATGHTSSGDPTCTEDSVCVVCDAVLKAATGHNYTDVAGKDATCTEDGFVAGQVCTVCGDTNGTDYAVIPALGHKYVWVETLAPTFAAEGKASATCGRCGTTDETVLPKKTPELLYTVEDLTAEEDAKVLFNKVGVTASEDGSYVTLTAEALDAYLEFLGDNFADVISIKYRAAATLKDFGGNRDGKFVLNGVDFFASVSGDNVINYNNEATVGKWTLLNIDLRKNQVDLNGVEYDMLGGAAIDTLKYVLFNGYVEGSAIDVEYIAFFNNKADAIEYAETKGEFTMPSVYVDSDKSHTTTLDNINGAGEYGAPGKFLNTNENNGVTVINWNGRFYNNYVIKLQGKVTVEGGVQRLVYSLDGGMSWKTLTATEAVMADDGSYVILMDLAKYAGKTIDLRIAGVVAVDEATGRTELVQVLNVKKLVVTKSNPNKLDVNFLAAAGNMADKTNVNATILGDYVHYTFAAGTAKPTLSLFNDAEGLNVKKFMLIKFRGNGSGYGTNYDFYLNVNGTQNIGGKKYNANWLNIILDNSWRYIIVDLSNNGAIDVSTIKTLDWVVFDAKAIGAANGDWLDVAPIEFYDTYADAMAVANPNGNYITKEENGSTISNFTFVGISAENSLVGNRVPAFTAQSTSPVLLSTVTLVDSDYQLNLAARLTSNVDLPAANLGIKVGNYDIVWGSSKTTIDATVSQFDFAFLLPADFALNQAYNVEVFYKSQTNGEIILLDTFSLTRQTVGINLGDADGKIGLGDNIAITAVTASTSDVVALYKGSDLVMYYTATATSTGFAPNGGTGVTVVNAELAKLATEGTYTVKLHNGGVNGGVLASKDVELLDAGVVSNGRWTAQQIYTSWKNLGGANWGFDAQIRNDGNGDYIRLTPNANNGDGGRIFLLFTGVHALNGGWNTNDYVGNYVLMKYRNHSASANQVNICYGTCGGCLAAGGNACGRGWIGTSANGWAISVQEGWKVPAGHSMMILRFAPGITIDIESIAIVTGWQGIGGNYDTLFGMYWN